MQTHDEMFLNGLRVYIWCYRTRKVKHSELSDVTSEVVNFAATSSPMLGVCVGIVVDG